MILMFKDVFKKEVMTKEESLKLYNSNRVVNYVDVPFETTMVLNHLQFSSLSFRELKKVRFTFSDDSITVTVFDDREKRIMTLKTEGRSYYFPRKTIDIDFQELIELKNKMNDSLFEIIFSTVENEKNNLDVLMTIRFRNSINEFHTFKLCETKKL
jgi:predicted CopG family antitoxin